METTYNLPDKIDHKLRIMKEKYEGDCMTVIIYEHACSEFAKFPIYLVYLKFCGIPASAIITDKNIDDINIINDRNPKDPNWKQYWELAIKITWDWELSQLVSAFKYSGLSAWPSEEEMKIESLREPS